MRTIKWVPTYASGRIKGTNTKMHGHGIDKQGHVKTWQGSACFSSWQWGDHFEKIGYKPKYHGLDLTRDQDTVVRYAVNKVIRKVFPIIPPYCRLRASDICLEFDTKEYTIMELNFMLRTLRAMHEQPSVISSCYQVGKLYPHLEAPWVLGLAAVGSWDTEGNISSHCTHHHGTYSGCNLARARTFDHIMRNKGKFFAGPHAEHPDRENGRYRYSGVSHLFERTAFPVSTPETYSKNISYSQDGDYKYNSSILVAAMEYVREKHIAMEGAKHEIRVPVSAIKSFVAKANEDITKKRIW